MQPAIVSIVGRERLKTSLRRYNRYTWEEALTEMGQSGSQRPYYQSQDVGLFPIQTQINDDIRYVRRKMMLLLRLGISEPFIDQ